MQTDKTNQTNKKEVRHPVVTVLGHVDHGKTTLLDCIRKTNIASRETGGITQHLGAYEIEWNGKKITFLDTPGHETFSRMRERGARVADVAVLVVAADDGVKPQTKEAIEAVKSASIPFVVALNKIDKQTAEPDRVKGELSEAGVLIEGWGGKVPCISISAKEGKNIDELLDTVLLMAELEELTWNRDMNAEGVVIEAHHDSRRGPSATLLVTNGTLKRGSFVLAGDAAAPVRILEDSAGNARDELYAASPACVAGFDRVPQVGATFRAYSAKPDMEADRVSAVRDAVSHDVAAGVGFMIKADTAGSLEALESELRKVVPEELMVKFFDGGMGEVTESDIKMASSASNAIIVAFRTKIKKNVEELAARLNVNVQSFDIIYEAIDWVKDEFAKMVPKKMIREDTGSLLVLKVFGAKPEGRIIGGTVRKGKVPCDSKFEIVRHGAVVGGGSVVELQRNKIKVDQLREGEQGGLLVRSQKTIAEKDTLMFFYEREA